LILLDELLGFNGPPGKVFEVVIQLGAILAICVVYFSRLWGVATGLRGDPAARRFVVAVLLAFLPAMVLGAGLHGYIKSVLFNPTVVSLALIVGGVAILLVERVIPPARHHAIESFPAPLALKIGLCQCLALIPGVSRSGASILGALLMGVDRKVAAEFSFFLAVPTMAGATVYDLYKNWKVMSIDDGALIAVGFVVAFVAAALVVKTLVDFVGRYGFAPFGWYRIVVGAAMLALLYV
jgi:undecaprenyl-diphosphatase